MVDRDPIGGGLDMLERFTYASQSMFFAFVLIVLFFAGVLFAVVELTKVIYG